jgi:ABC-type dipeptide/oligopeptide/nickel transport system permease subunit
VSWAVWAPPGAMIALTVIACKLLGDGHRAALDV